MASTNLHPSEVFDACIIGTGPVGLASALTLAGQGLKVALVESGQESDQAAIQALGAAKITNSISHAPMAHCSRRGLGGTSAWWGGRCVPLDEVDFLPRVHVPLSGWPLSMQQVNEYLEAANLFLGAGPAHFTVERCKNLPTAKHPLSERMQNTSVLKSTDLERWSGSPNAWQAHREAVLKSNHIRLFSGHTCVGWHQPGTSAAVTEVILKTSPGSEPFKLKARVHILAAGGVESTRLDLHSATAEGGLRPENLDGIGRHYMGHPSGKLASIELYGAAEKTLFGFERDAQVYVRRRLTLSTQAQLDQQLLNISFWTDNPPIADANHGSGVLSAAYLALTAPLLGSRLAPAAIRERVTGGQPVVRLPHLINCVKSPLATLAFTTRFAYQRYAAKPRLPGFFTQSANNVYALHYHAEQSPNPNSRITLSGDCDAMGIPKATINLVWSDPDLTSIIKAHDVLKEALETAKIGTLTHLFAPDKQREAIIDQAIDGFHQIGTLRMAHTSKDGVTDSDGRLFGTPNFYIAGSALFPTSGQANPTLVAVSLAIRQAHHIAKKQSSQI